MIDVSRDVKHKDKGHKVCRNVTGFVWTQSVSKRDRLWVRFPLEKIKNFIFSFLRSGVKIKHSTGQHPIPLIIWRKIGRILGF